MSAIMRKIGVLLQLWNMCHLHITRSSFFLNKRVSEVLVKHEETKKTKNTKEEATLTKEGSQKDQASQRKWKRARRKPKSQ